jgi:GTP-binding protein Era
MQNEKKCGFVVLLGRPSSGKSSLLNRVVGYKTSIVSELPQTTQKRIRGIYHADDGQIIFLDTPGLHESPRVVNQFMTAQADGAIADADVLVYVIDAHRSIGAEETLIAQKVSESHIPVIVALNKHDQTPYLQQEYHTFLQHWLPQAPIISTSVVTGYGIDALLQQIFQYLPTGPALYPSDIYTDQDPAFRIAELIREQAMARVHAEVPHSIYVDIADMEQREDFLWVRAFIMVERDSQKGMLVGKGGETIRAIRLSASKGIKKLFPYPVQLDLQVKVDKDWRSNSKKLKKLFGDYMQ